MPARDSAIDAPPRSASREDAHGGALAEALRTVACSPDLNQAWRDPRHSHSEGTALFRHVVAKLLLAALAPPRGLGEEPWQRFRAQLAGDSTPRFAGWSAAHDERLGALAESLPPLPPGELGYIYEQWLRTPPHRDPRTGEVRLDTAAAHRKAGGCFYTPQRLTRELTAETLAALPPSSRTRPPRVVDPSCGTGAFLQAALDWLAERAGDAATAVVYVAAHSLHGADVDAVAVGLARVLLFHAVAERSPEAGTEALNGLATALRANLRAGDALLGRGFAVDETNDDNTSAIDWQRAFPAAAKAGGFDVVLGNPPWDKVKPLAREFFAERDPQLAKLNRRAFDKEVAERLRLDATVAAEWEAHQRDAKAYAAALRARYRLQGRGDANLYKAFLERAFSLLAPHGQLGLVLPYAFCIDLGATELRREALARHAPLAITRHASGEETFGITNAVNFVTLRASGAAEAKPSDRQALVETRRAGGTAIALSRRLIELVSPESLSLPEVQQPEDVPRLERLYRGAPLLGGTPTGVLRVRWRRELDMTLDRELFNTDGDGLPVFEGKMIHQYRPTWAGNDPASTQTRERVVWVKETPPLSERGLPFPRYWVRPEQWCGEAPGYRCAVRLIQNSHSRRVLIATVLPPGVVAGNSLATAMIDDAACGHDDEVAALRNHLFLCSWLNDDELDWLIRLKIDANLNMFHLKQLPLPKPFAADSNGKPLNEEAYQQAHRSHGIRALKQLLAHAPQIYASLRDTVLAPEDDWSQAARKALQANDAAG